MERPIASAPEPLISFCTYSEEMASGDGEADSECSRAFDIVPPFIADAEHSKHQQEGDEHLDPKGLFRQHIGSQPRVAERATQIGGHQPLYANGMLVRGDCMGEYSDLT